MESKLVYLAYVVSAFCFVNGLPHFVQGVCGHKFQSPFASPPGVGESSPLVNVIWGWVNFVLGYALLVYAGFFEVGLNVESCVFFCSAFSSSILLSVLFGRIRS